MLQQLIPEALRPYSLLHSHLTHSHQMVTCLVFTDNETLVSGSRDCHVSIPMATFINFMSCTFTQYLLNYMYTYMYIYMYIYIRIYNVYICIYVCS